MLVAVVLRAEDEQVVGVVLAPGPVAGLPDREDVVDLDAMRSAPDAPARRPAEGCGLRLRPAVRLLRRCAAGVGAEPDPTRGHDAAVPLAEAVDVRAVGERTPGGQRVGGHGHQAIPIPTASQQLSPSGEVADGCHQEVHVVSESAEAGVATATEQAADLARVVVVVDLQPRLLAAYLAPAVGLLPQGSEGLGGDGVSLVLPIGRAGRAPCRGALLAPGVLPTMRAAASRARPLVASVLHRAHDNALWINPA